MSDVPHAEAYGSGEPGLEGDCELDAACSADVETAPPPRPTRSPAAAAALIDRLRWMVRCDVASSLNTLAVLAAGWRESAAPMRGTEAVRLNLAEAVGLNLAEEVIRLNISTRDV